jgi:aminoglycoside phosphotransferase (APT) family kinase protein
MMPLHITNSGQMQLVRGKEINMTFKAHWEKTSERFDLPLNVVEKMVNAAYPGDRLELVEVIAGGCANLNIKIKLKDLSDPLILRVYLRDAEAAWREQKLAKLLSPTIPIPQVLNIYEHDGYTYAIAKFMPGIALRDLLLANGNPPLGKIMYKVAVMLSVIAKHKFTAAGFFDKHLHVVKELDPNGYLDFVKTCLKNDVILSVLDTKIISEIEHFINKYSALFPTNQNSCLVHADFDPANILVSNTQGNWEITGILDWEFAFAGSMLCDVANMLRYAHKMPIEFEQGFLKGLQDSGVQLPQNWRITVDMLNLLSLLDCLTKAAPEYRPKQYADILELVTHILERSKTLPQTDDYL